MNWIQRLRERMADILSRIQYRRDKRSDKPVDKRSNYGTWEHKQDMLWHSYRRDKGIVDRHRDMLK